MTLRRSWRSQQYITGRCPLGAQVRRTSGWSIRPVSSRNSMILPVLAAFFYARPVHFPPPGDGPLIALPRPALGLLATPVQGQKNPPDLAGIVGHIKGLLDHFADPRQGPQFGLVAKMGRSFQE